MGRLVLEGNSFYEIDEECIRSKNTPDECKTRQLYEDKLNMEKNANIKIERDQ